MMSSPRLRSPRGSTPRNNNHPQSSSCLLGIVRHTRVLLVFLVLIMLWTNRPGARDPGNNLSVQKEESDDPPVAASIFPINTTILTTAAPTKAPLPEVVSTLSTYDPSKAPLFAVPTLVDAHFVVDITATTVDPASKYLLDGLGRSSWVNLIGIAYLEPNLKRVSVHSRVSKHPLVFVVDWGSMNRDCHRLKRALEELDRQPKDHVLLVDPSPSMRQTKCDFWDFRVRMAKRNIVRGRHFRSSNLDRGTLMNNTGTPGGPIIHAPLVIRERFVQAIQENSNNDPLASKRVADVAFFHKLGDYSHYAFWRRQVGWALAQYATDHKSKKVMVDTVVSDEEGVDQGNIQLDYVQALLKCKIVVVAQRDEWEDHYRLFESMASGAMVLMDTMLAPPSGLKNNTNVVMYTNVESLKRLISYYLKDDKKRQSIAKRGYQLALGQHRPWHRIEQMLFGQPLTQVDQPNDPAPKIRGLPSVTLLQEVESVPT